ncbi:uncharacterized protein SPPG_06666 [Spizellomyces punctatus DAOM BR117]|uniref:Transmembrane protein 135 N-terminal domain-containing protein n=1 Tax=Spizellomyces punctatus (strain DAOM BR117) TaxID=645134 RepID=A0A0L0HBY1_SPIPD|nr:uncharacterized protein SPPG_06666 [Spizellomyces punctatus DAOM BR117]KNC98268.1 hypothetical protein SPPG_06666 [Spizellomyces punctatus DAOM BR117]|eukprot:XP_016606308.1 hypothetical protein SPPG_06666 [Spizellomyces punctatus DAOM BR117]
MVVRLPSPLREKPTFSAMDLEPINGSVEEGIHRPKGAKDDDDSQENVKIEETVGKYPAPVTPNRWKGVNQIIVHALRGGMRSFLLAYAMRGGVSFLIRLVRVLKGRLSLLAALRAFFSGESRRFALMIGSFSFSWKLINNLLFHFRGRQSKLNGFIAGSIAGLSILFEEKETRMSIAQQFLVRSMQAGYNALKARDVVHFPYGDTALFMVACGSILYAYIMQPGTIPKEYYSWMIKTARMPVPMLNFNRSNYRAWEQSAVKPLVDTKLVTDIITHNREGYHPSAVPRALEYISRNNGTMPIVPCSVLHPTDPSCITYNSKLLGRVMIGIAPVYAALNFVPMVLLKTGKFVKNPGHLTTRGILSTFRSSLFLGVFVFIYMSGICTQRNIATSRLGSLIPYLSRDHKLVYYLLGLLCSTSILIEHKSRRSELAMYVLPKGLQSLWMVLHQRGRMFRVPNFEIYMSSVAMGILMSVYQTEPQRMSSLLFKVMEKIIGRN